MQLQEHTAISATDVLFHAMLNLLLASVRYKIALIQMKCWRDEYFKRNQISEDNDEWK